MLVEEYPGKVMTFTQNRPMIGGAIRDGIDIIEASHMILYSLNLAHDLSVVTEMIECAQKAPETICTVSRWKGGLFYGYSKVKLAMNYLAQIFLRLIFRQKLTDMTNPTQIAPTELYKSIERENCGFPFLLEASLKPIKLGCKFTEISTNCYSRAQGKSSNSFRQTAAYLKTAFHIRFMKKEDCLKPEYRSHTDLSDKEKTKKQQLATRCPSGFGSCLGRCFRSLRFAEASAGHLHPARLHDGNPDKLYLCFAQMKNRRFFHFLIEKHPY